MSASPSSINRTESTRSHRLEFVLQIPTSISSSPARDASKSATLAPRPGLARHYTSLQEHADAVRGQDLTPGGGSGSTPRAEERREGFTWEVRKDADTPTSPILDTLPRPNTPPSMEEIMRATTKERESRGGVQSVARVDSYQSIGSAKRVSTGSSLNSTVSRSDSHRASFSGIARGIMSHAPDMRSFLPMEKQHEDDEDASIGKGRRGSTVGRQLKFNLPHTAAKRDKEKEEAPKPTKAPPEKPASIHKVTLKDRRKVAQGESMKLTLPSNISQLPSRGRTPVFELTGPTSSRPRSSKTPWVHNYPQDWPPSGLASAPATIFEDGDVNTPGLLPGHDPLTSSQTPHADFPGGRHRNRRSLPRLRLGRAKSWHRRSDSPARSADGNFPLTNPLAEPTQTQMEHAQYAQQVQTREELKEVGKRSRCRRLRWSGPWSSTGNSETPDTPSSGGRTSFFLTRVLKPMRSCQNDDISSPETPPAERALRRRKRHADMEKIANMSVPPIFIPPGTSRVPTPPMLDANGEVKGKLADFFFNIEGVRTRKPPATPGGIWDSDAVLMSQTTDISLPSTESDESPQALAVTPLTLEDVTPGIAVITPNATYSNVRTTPPALVDTSGSEAWFRMPSSPRRDSTQSNRRAAEEKAKLEWLIPEHLPTSPLCPLHVKYVGPSIGVCVFHGRRKSASGGKGTRRESGVGRRSGTMDGSGEHFGWVEAWTFRASRRRQRVSSSGCSP